MNLYDDPQVYDVLYTPGTARECDVLERIARTWVRTRTAQPLWLEPACGSGRYLRVLGRRGHRLQGFDRSAAMVRYARTQAPQARLFQADLVDFAPALRPHTVDFAFNLFNTIRHLENDAAVRAHFRQMAQVLRPGGVYAVGLSFTVYGQELMDEDLWEGRRGALHVQQLAQYLPPGTWEHLHPPARAARGARGARDTRGARSASRARDTRDPRGARDTRDTRSTHPSRHPRFERVISQMRITRGARTEESGTHYDLRCYDAAEWQALIAGSPLRSLATLDMTGRPVEDRPVYALELLGRREALAPGRPRTR